MDNLLAKMAGDPEKHPSNLCDGRIALAKSEGRHVVQSSLLSRVVRFCIMMLYIISIAFIISSLTQIGSSWHVFDSSMAAAPSLRIGQIRAEVTSTATPTALQCFQVHEPVLTPFGLEDDDVSSGGHTSTETLLMSLPSAAPICSVELMRYSFGYSYGMPFVGNYTPPSCKFNTVVMNLTVTSKGRQFDRLAIMYFGDSEVFRTSTAEPTANGIEWTYIKDMTEYLYFWTQPQTIIFDLGNLVDSTYTGLFNTTLTATFFHTPETISPASLILPVSARRASDGKASVFTLPEQTAINRITLPRNINKAIFTISACGQANEEFWWSNVLSSDVNTFANTTGALYGYSSFREVQLLIDGQLAGVQWPFPVVFTGGIVPGLWRPIVGIDAFDLREHQIDITPWVGLLCDGSPHTFEIKVVGIEDDGRTSGSLSQTVGSSWYVTGKIFLWQDSVSSITTGSSPVVISPSPGITLSRTIGTSENGTNQTLGENIAVHRTLAVASTIKTQHSVFAARWTQVLSYTNLAQISQEGALSINTLKTTGVDTASGMSTYTSVYEYPLYASQSYIVDPTGSGNFTLSANVSRGLTLSVSGASIFPSSAQPYSLLQGISSLTASQLADTTLSTVQNGSATYFGYKSGSAGFGATSQTFDFLAGGGAQEVYHRDVTAVNGSVVSDRETLLGRTLNTFAAVTSVGGAGYEDLPVISGPREVSGKRFGRLSGEIMEVDGLDGGA